MMDAIAKEIEHRKNYLFGTAESNVLDTIYFGGGTPSLLNANDFEVIFTTLSLNYKWNPDTEITLECNPDDVTEEKLMLWKKYGINRLSIGVQSFIDNHLLTMNRSHNAAMAIHAVELANKCGIDNISIDLIYGLPDLSPADWQANLKTAEQLPINHISCYALTIEERTALSHFVKTKKINIPTDEIVITQFKELVDWAMNNNFDHYEISNFCKVGFHSRHNSSYWSGKNYIGIGPSAHSYNGHSRQWNIANNNAYIDSVTNSKPYFEAETLTQENKYNEYVMIHLRTKAGVDILQLQQQFGNEYTSHFEKKIAAYVAQNQVVVMQNNYALTMEGKLFADAIAGDCFVEV